MLSLENTGLDIEMITFSKKNRATTDEMLKLLRKEVEKKKHKNNETN